ncbi:MAG: hypothetical protein P8L20_04480 [Flavobacteriales bacterium]|nr:hypothetical protein [Flavobacteriales bacterium]
MESKNDIDKLFKDKLGHREFDIKESFLADLEGKLEAQKPRKKLWWMFFYSLIALVGVSVLTYIVSTNNVNDTIDSQVTMEETKQYVVSNKVKNTGIEGVETETTDKLVDLDTEAFQDEQQEIDTYTTKEALTDGINKELPENISNDKNATTKTNTLKNNEKPYTSRNGESKTSSVNNSEKDIAVASDSQTEVKEGTESSIMPSEKVYVSDQEIKEMNSNNSKASNVELFTDKNESMSLAKESNTKTENESLVPVNLDTLVANSSSVVLTDTDTEVVDSNKGSVEDSISINVNRSTELIASKDSVLIDKETTQIVSDTIMQGSLPNENQITTGDLGTTTSEKEIINENDAVSNEEIIDITILAIDSIVIDSLVLEKEISEEFSDMLTKDDSLANKVILTPEDATFKKWTFSVFGGPSLVSKKLTGGSSDAYLAKRNNEETNIVSMSYGLRLNYNLSEKINISLGANSLTYGEDVNYSTIYNTETNMSTVSKDSTYLDYVYTAVQDSNGGWDTILTTIVVDTTFMVDTTIINVNATDYAGKNRFTYLQIPIMFGYKFTFNKLSVNIRLGGSYGVLLKNSGSYVDNNVSNIELPNLRKTMINMVASTTIAYQLKKMNVFVEPKFRLNSGSIITHPEIKQHYTSIGCNFGLSFDF